jgi:putative ABC transport system permease protein
MLRNYMNVAIRSLLRHKGYSLINIVGLAIGLAVCILIFQYVRTELAYDAFHENGEDIYRIVTSFRQETGELEYSALSPIRLGPALAEQYPDITRFTRFLNRTTVVKSNGRVFNELLLFADTPVLSMFSFEMVRGNPDEALTDKYSVILSESAAEKYFGASDPMGKTISIKAKDGFADFVVTGVVENVPYNSTIKFDFLLPYVAILDELSPPFKESWGANTTRTYVQLAKGSSAALLEQKLPGFLDTHLRQRLGDRPHLPRFHLQPLRDIHLDPRISYRLEPTNNPVYLYMLSAIGIFILILACINVTNLAVGQASTRLKEVGTRKVVGAGRKELVKQFLGESVALSVLAMCVALVLAEIFAPVFNVLANTRLSINYVGDWTVLPMLLGLVLLVSIVAGGYPALYLSRFNPAEIIRGSVRVGKASVFTRSLVVLQFSLSIFFIICTLFMSGQMSYMRNMNLGFEDDQVVIIRTGSADGGQALELMRNELRFEPSIKSIAGAGQSLGRVSTYMATIAECADMDAECYVFRIDQNYLSTMGMELTQGRNFSEDFPADPRGSVIVNQSFVEKLGLASPLAKKVKLPIGGALEDNAGAIVGVVEDFNFLSLQNKVEPAVLHMSPEHSIRYIAVKISPEEVGKTIGLLKDSWSKVAPDAPFEYYFLDEDFNRQYAAEERWSSIFGYSSFFAIFIASLGLLGITTLAVGRRTKEIGIRKVLGATAAGLVRLISKEFLLLVLIANVVAWPVAYYAASRWLENYAYRISIGWGVFVLAGLLAFLIALITVTFQAVKAALANPVESLRYE